TRYASSTSACGTWGSLSETQTCLSSGSFNGTYTLTTAPTATTRTMYATATVACGSTCSGQTQTCQSNGTWSPSTNTYASCTPNAQEWLYYDNDGDGYGMGPANLRCYVGGPGALWLRNNTDCLDDYMVTDSDLVHPDAGYQAYLGPNNGDWDCSGNVTLESTLYPIETVGTSGNIAVDVYNYGCNSQGSIGAPVAYYTSSSPMSCGTAYANACMSAPDYSANPRFYVGGSTWSCTNLVCGAWTSGASTIRCK
ncbi:MAG: hypothetical protein WC099_03675, partial [Candidatus Paceibacterota bacterium]